MIKTPVLVPNARSCPTCMEFKLATLIDRSNNKTVGHFCRGCGWILGPKDLIVSTVKSLGLVVPGTEVKRRMVYPPEDGICWCGKKLTARQKKFCSLGHSAAYNNYKRIREGV